LALLLMTALLASCGGDDDPVAPVEINGAPSAPAIAAGAPADGSVDVALTASLGWGATDPDGDPLTYTVHFGTAAAPPVVAEDHDTVDYTPAGLVNGTTYHWQVTASDGKKSTPSPIWSFTTVALDAETVTAPVPPGGPATGEVNETLSYTVTGGSSSEGHALEYRLDWDDGTYSDWGTGNAVGHAWTNAGSYEVRAQVRCGDHPTIVSVWSAAATVAISGPEAISTPDVPSGPATGETSVTLRYDVTGMASSHGHEVDIRFDWGNGIITAWTAADWGATQWHTAGTYEIRVQARCRQHTAILSDWSAAATVTISEPAETVTVPTIRNAPASAGSGDVVQFDAWAAGTNLSHDVEYRYDWNDGQYSDWGPKVGSYYSASHAWSATGSYEVRAQARCATHPDVVSDWSAASVIEISAVEAVSPPTINIGSEVTVDLDGWLFPIANFAESNMGHLIELQWDLGTGTLEPWGGSASPPLRFFDLGDFTIRVRARCREHTDVVSDWSNSVLVHVIDLETMDGQPTLAGSATATVGVPAVFTVSGVTSSFGHELEYQLYDGYNDSVPGVGQGWTTADNLSITWNTATTRVVQVQARCADHPEIESVKSNYLWVTITD
jgi:hypothetical protein